jgi:hypothetical protein
MMNSFSKFCRSVCGPAARVIPAKAGTQPWKLQRDEFAQNFRSLGPGLRRDDAIVGEI